MLGDQALQFVDRPRRPEKVELVEARADRPLDAPQRVPVQELRDPPVPEHRLGRRVSEALPERRGLRGHIVGAGHHHRRGMGLGQIGQPGDHRHQVVADHLQRLEDQQLLGVLGDISGGHAQMDRFVAGEGAELVDPGLHVVAGDGLPGGNRLEVDNLQHRLVGVDDSLLDIEPESALGFQHRQPQPALQHHAALVGPHGPHPLTGVAARQHVGAGGLHRYEPRSCSLRSRAARATASLGTP